MTGTEIEDFSSATEITASTTEYFTAREPTNEDKCVGARECQTVHHTFRHVQFQSILRVLQR